MRSAITRKFATYLSMPILAVGVLSGAAVTTAAVANAAGGHGAAGHATIAAVGPHAAGGAAQTSPSAPIAVSSLSAQHNIGTTTDVFGRNAPNGTEPAVPALGQTTDVQQTTRVEQTTPGTEPAVPAA